MNTYDEQTKKDIKSQIDYAVMKYGGNRPPSLVKAEAEALAAKAMKSYNPSSGGVKTYLSSRLQKLSRNAYKSSVSIKIPEKRLMARTKLRDFIDGHKDTYGFQPEVKDVAKGLGVSHKEADRLISEYGAIRTESSFSNNKVSAPGLSGKEIIMSLPLRYRNLAEDMYLKNISDESLQKKHGVKKETITSYRRRIGREIKRINLNNNIERS